MTECIYCGATDHSVTETIIGKVTACPRMPVDRVIMLSPRSIAILESARRGIVEYEIGRLIAECDP